jgi:signal transduction histidine kinase
MTQIQEFFSGIFSTSEWPARWKCGYWSDFHGWLYIASELMIWVSYFLIPLIILNYLRKKNTILKFNTAYIYFAAFILLCGSTHFLDALMFWVPVYRFNALVRFATAVVSVLTVYHLIKILPDAFRQKTSVELEQEIRKRTEAEERLEHANKGLQAFAYMASHDLQEPLRKIQIYTSELVQSCHDKLNDKEKQWAYKVHDGAERMSIMIKDVLSLSAITGDATLSMVNTAAAVNTAIEDLEMKILEKNAVINVGNLPPVMGNQAYLSQLFFNLLNNAIKFSKRDPVINVSGEIKDDKVLISVSDNGIGINEDSLDQIFEAFHRLNSRTEYEGSGIGLSICKRIVDIHKGAISVQSAIGEGTTFFIEFQSVNVGVKS